MKLDALKETKDAIEKAHRTVVALCRQEIEWQMTIPVDVNRDPDVIIGGALRAANRIIHQLEAENTRLRGAIERIASMPNGPDNHTNACVLHRVEPGDWDDESICDCGYWASSFAQVKITAMKALSDLEGSDDSD